MDIQKEREAFEDWFESQFESTKLHKFDDGVYWHERAQMSWEAWQAAKAQANKQFEGFIDQAIEDSACADERRSLQILLDEFQEQAND